MDWVGEKVDCGEKEMHCVKEKMGEMEWIVSERRWERCRGCNAVRNQRYRVSPLWWVFLKIIM